MTNQDDLPENWERARSSNENTIVGTYQHKYLEVELSIVDVEIEPGNRIYSIMPRWADDFGMVEADFEVDPNIQTEQEAEDWMMALMTQIDGEFVPGDTEYVDRAMRATKGQSTSEPDPRTSPDRPDCPVCNAPIFQFRGFDSYEQAQNHFEYMDDSAHDGWDISVEDISN